MAGVSYAPLSSAPPVYKSFSKKNIASSIATLGFELWDSFYLLFYPLIVDRTTTMTSQLSQCRSNASQVGDKHWPCTTLCLPTNERRQFAVGDRRKHLLARLVNPTTISDNTWLLSSQSSSAHPYECEKTRYPEALMWSGMNWYCVL